MKRPRLYSFLDGAFSSRTVGRERDVLRHGSVELQDAVRRRLCSAHAAAWLASLPKAQQRALVRRGRAAIKTAARAVRREYERRTGTAVRRVTTELHHLSDEERVELLQALYRLVPLAARMRFLVSVMGGRGLPVPVEELVWRDILRGFDERIAELKRKARR